MGYRKKILLLFFGSVVFFALCYCFWWYTDKYGNCQHLQSCLNYQLYMGLIKPLIYFSPVLFGVLIYLLFFPQKVFSRWLKWMIVVIPLLVLDTATTPIFCQGIICSDKEMIARFDSFLFGLISFLVITISAVIFYRQKYQKK